MQSSKSKVETRRCVLYPCNHVTYGKIKERRMTFSHFPEVVSHVKGQGSPFSYYMHAKVSILSTILSMAGILSTLIELNPRKFDHFFTFE